MSTRKAAVITAAWFAIALCVSVVSSDEKPAMAQADMVAPDGSAIGTVTFEQTPSGVLINVDVTNLPPGPHGIHLHEFGACTPDFSAAKGHINPDGVAHGLRHPDGPDQGDLPLLFVHADGTARAEFYHTRVNVVGGNDNPTLLDEDGSSVIIHDKPDDHFTQPIGGAGGRIACGVIKGL